MSKIYFTPVFSFFPKIWYFIDCYFESFPHNNHSQKLTNMKITQFFVCVIIYFVFLLSFNYFELKP